MDHLASGTGIAADFERSQSGGAHEHEVSISSIISNLSQLIDGNNSSYFVHAADSWSAFDRKVMEPAIQEFEKLATEQKKTFEPATEKETSFGFIDSQEARLLIDKDEEVRDQFLKSANASFASGNNSVCSVKLPVADLSGIQRYFRRRSSFPINNRANDSSMFHDHTAKHENGSLLLDNTDIENQSFNITMHKHADPSLSPLNARTMSLAKFLKEPGTQNNKESIMDFVLGLCRRMTEEGLVEQEKENECEPESVSFTVAQTRYPSFAAHIVPQGIENNLKEARKTVVSSEVEELPVRDVKAILKLKGQPRGQREPKDTQSSVPSQVAEAVTFFPTIVPPSSFLEGHLAHHQIVPQGLKNNVKEARKPLVTITEEEQELPIRDVEATLKSKGQPRGHREPTDTQSAAPSQGSVPPSRCSEGHLAHHRIVPQGVENNLKEARKILVAFDAEELPVRDVKAPLKLKGQLRGQGEPKDTQSSALSQVSEAVESFPTIVPPSCSEGHLAQHHIVPQVLKNTFDEARKPLVISDAEKLPVLDVKATLTSKGELIGQPEPEDTQSSALSQVSEAVESFPAIVPPFCSEGHLANHPGGIPGGFGFAYPFMVPILFPMPYPMQYYPQQNGQLHANNNFNPFSAHVNFSGLCHNCGQLNSKNDEKPVK